MSGPIVAETVHGRVRGAHADGALAFRGVPFATAPRFAPPGPATAWSGERAASAPGPAAPQPQRGPSVFTHGALPATAEECLNLSVFTPSLDGRRPVLVWIHGGGFAIGHGAAGLYGGSRLALAAEIVVVCVNYRLGSLGWLAHPALAAAPGAPGAPCANWGLLDQIAALEWVRDNAAAFGGDPATVIVAGQSAGALSTMDLLVSPGAAGLFRRAILQSPPMMDAAQPMARGVQWAQALGAAAAAGSAAGAGGAGARATGAGAGAAGAGAGATGAGAGAEKGAAPPTPPALDVAALRALDADRIVAVHEALLDTPEFRGTRGGALPTIDPATLPVSPVELPGTRPEIDVLIGATADEGTFFFNAPWRPAPPPERIPDIVAHLCHTDTPGAVLERYRARAAANGQPSEPLDLLVRIATDAMIATPVADWAAQRAAAGGRVHRYRVDHPGGGPVLRATHTAEVPLLFGTWRDGDAGERLAGQAAGAAPVAAEIVGAWTRFIHGESPGWTPVPAQAGAEAEVGVFGGDSPFSIAAEPAG